MTLYDDLDGRGLVHQSTHETLPEVLVRGPVRVYCGFDPTADSLHIGSLLPILHLRRFQLAGHTPIALLGGGTGLIGDPSGKTVERQLLSEADAERNVECMRRQLERFLDFEGSNAAVMPNNLDWLRSLSLVEFLRDIGKHFSINSMIAKESVRQRVEDREHGMSFTEFTYSLLQAYDFYHLHREYDCTLQVGGSDQWGNIVAGIDLVRRLSGAEVYGLTFPLLTKADGSKFGKSEAGNVWLDPEKTSPYAFYQFWLNQADADAVRLLRYFTFLSHDAIRELEKAVETAPEQRQAQKALAENVTRLVHGDDGLAKALRATQAMFGGDVSGLDDATLAEIFADVPSSELPRDILNEDRLLVDVLADSGVFASKGEARRMIKNGGLNLNNQRISSEDAKLTSDALCSETIAVVRKGKKNYHLLRFK